MTYYHWLGQEAESYDDDTEYEVEEGAPFFWIGAEADGFVTTYPEL